MKDIFERDMAGEPVSIDENIIAVDSPAAVSYTHLDVYKRQGPRRDARPAGERRSGGALEGCLSHRAVSYTHLFDRWGKKALDLLFGERTDTKEFFVGEKKSFRCV